MGRKIIQKQLKDTKGVMTLRQVGKTDISRQRNIGKELREGGG